MLSCFERGKHPELAAFAEGLEPHEVREVYIHGAEKPDTWVDIADVLEALDVAGLFAELRLE